MHRLPLLRKLLFTTPIPQINVNGFILIIDIDRRTKPNKTKSGYDTTSTTYCTSKHQQKTLVTREETKYARKIVLRRRLQRSPPEAPSMRPPRPGGLEFSCFARLT